MSERDNDLDLLVAGHLDDALDASSAQRLHEHLRTDVAARRLLLMAATQASVLPRTALEAGLTQLSTAVPAPLRSARWRWWSGVAALLMIGVGLGWLLPQTSERDVRVAASPDLVVVRGDQSATASPWVQTGDQLVVGANGARLEWTHEGTGIDLQAGANLVIEQLGSHKRLRLNHGALTAEVAPQGAGGLRVMTPFGDVEVVGTRFHIQVDDTTSTVQVDHGAVRVIALQDPTPVTVAAGFAVVLAANGQRPSSAPLAALPMTSTASGGMANAPSIVPAGVVRLGVDTYRVNDGWEGDLVDGAIRGRPVDGSPVTRITTPVQRPDGFTRFDRTLRVMIDLTVDQPTTLAVLLVCDHADGGARWLANVQAEQVISSGAQQVMFSADDFRVTTSGPRPPLGSRIVAVAVMSWQPAADLRLRAIELRR